MGPWMEARVTRYTRPICILATASLLLVSVTALGSFLGPKFWNGNEALPVVLGGLGGLGLIGAVLAWRIPRAIVTPIERRVRFRTPASHSSGAMSKPWGPWGELRFEEIDAVIFDHRLVTSHRTQGSPRRLCRTHLRANDGRRHEIHEGVLGFWCRRQAAEIARDVGVRLEIFGDEGGSASAKRTMPVEASAPEEDRVREACAELASECFPDGEGVSWELVGLSRAGSALEVEIVPDPPEAIGYARIRLRVVDDGGKLRVTTGHAAEHHQADWILLFEG